MLSSSLLMTMSLSMDSSEGLLRHVLIHGVVAKSPAHNLGNEPTQSFDINHSNSMVNSTPSNLKSLSSTPPVFALPTFSPLKHTNNSTPSSSSPSDANSKTSPTTWLPSQRHSRSSLPSSSSPFSSAYRKFMSPILNLAKIDERKVLTTQLYTETPEQYVMNPTIPGTIVTSATPEGKDVAESNQNPERHSHNVKQNPTGSELDNISFRLKSLSCSPGLDRSPGLIISPGDGVRKRYLKFRRSDITFGEFIGKGAFGSVHKGSIAGSPVAVKIVQKRRGSGIHREILQAERLAFKLNLRHENIVGIYGINLCEELRGDALILMELVSSKSLQSLLEDATTDITRTERLSISLQVAKALSYLHSHSVAHLDVKPANVLMTSDHVCKLSDFGNLTLTGPHVRKEEPEFTQLLGTLPYRAPELMTGLFPTTKADIYSFGIMLWQMLTRESPHKTANPHALIYQVVKWNIRPIIPETGDDAIESMYAELYTLCWSRDLDKRPDASEIISRIQTITQQEES